MLAEGVSKFCDDLKLDPASIVVLVVAWKFQVLSFEYYFDLQSNTFTCTHVCYCS